MRPVICAPNMDWDKLHNQDCIEGMSQIDEGMETLGRALERVSVKRRSSVAVSATTA